MAPSQFINNQMQGNLQGLATPKDRQDSYKYMHTSRNKTNSAKNNPGKSINTNRTSYQSGSQPTLWRPAPAYWAKQD